MAATIDIKRVLARNTAWNYAGFALNLGTNLVMFPYVVHRIGDAAAGVWLLLSSITGYMGLLELGIVPSLAQTIAACRARRESQAVSRISSSALALLVLLAAFSLLLVPAVPTLVRALGISDVLRPEALLAFTIAIVGFALRMPQATLQGILLGYQRQDRCNQLWIALGLAKFGAAVVVLAAGYGLVGLVFVEAALHLLAAILQFRWVRAEDSTLGLSWRLVNVDDARRLLSFGSALLAVTICSLVIEQTDRLVIAAFLSVTMVTYYAAAWKIYMLSFALTTTLVQAVSQIAAGLNARGDRDAVRRLFLRWTKYTVAVAWPMVFSFALAGGFLLKVWMGDRYVSALPVVQVLLVGFVITAHNHAGYSVLIGMRRVGPMVGRYFAPQAVLNLVLSIWLVRRFGNVGVALGTLLPAILLEYAFLDFVLSEVGVAWREFLRGAVGPVAAAAFISYLPLLLAYNRLAAESALLPAIAVACGAAYTLVLWRLLDEGEREALIAHVPPGVLRRGLAVFSPKPLSARPDHS